MGAGNPTISGETETQVRAACQPRQPHNNKIYNTPLNVKRNTYPKKSEESRPYNDVNTYSVYFYLYVHKMKVKHYLIAKYIRCINTCVWLNLMIVVYERYSCKKYKGS